MKKTPKTSPVGVSPKRVFLNLAYEVSLEPVFLGMVATVIALGRTPVIISESPDTEDVRIARIANELKRCAVSIHDLSWIREPVRFNMPFELGLAYGIRLFTRRKHKIVVLDSTKYQLDKHLSDLRGIDNKVHGGSMKGTVRALLDVLARENTNLAVKDVLPLARKLEIAGAELKDRHARADLYGSHIFRALIAAAIEIATEEGLISS